MPMAVEDTKLGQHPSRPMAVRATTMSLRRVPMATKRMPTVKLRGARRLLLQKTSHLFLKCSHEVVVAAHLQALEEDSSTTVGAEASAASALVRAGRRMEGAAG